MPRYKEQDRVTPDTVEKMQLEPQANPVDMTVKQVFDEGKYRQVQGALDGLAKLGQGVVDIEDTMQRKANETALEAVFKTKEENKHKWSEVSRNIKGMAKFNPYNDDAFRRLTAGDITSQKIAQMKSIPDMVKLSPEQFKAEMERIQSEMMAEYDKAGLESNDYYYNLDKYDKERKNLQEYHTVKHAEHSYKQLNIARSYNTARGLDETLYNYDHFDSIGHVGMLEKGTIDINNRKVVKNPDGSISTDASIVIEEADSYVVIPTVVDGKHVTPEEAIKHYDETGEHHGKFESQETAEFYAQELHERGDYYYHDRDKARALLGYLNRTTNQLTAEGTPDSTQAEILVDSLKQYVTQHPKALTSPEWERVLTDLRINNKSLGELLPSQSYDMHNFITQAKRAAYQDEVLEHQQKQLDMQLKQEDAMVEYMDWLAANPNGDRAAKVKELAVKYGLNGVYRLQTFDVMSKGYASISGLDSVIDDPDTVANLIHKAADGTLTIKDLDNAYSQKQISTSTLSSFVKQQQSLKKEKEGDDKIKANYHQKRASEYLFGNDKMGIKGIITDKGLTAEAYNELNDIAYQYTIDGDYKKYNDAIASLKSRYAGYQRELNKPKTFNNMKAIAAKVNQNPTPSRQQYNRAMGMKFLNEDALLGKNNIFRDKNDPTKNNKHTSMRDGMYNYQGIGQKSHNTNRDYHKAWDVSSDNAACYVPYSCRNNKGMYVAAVYKGKNGGFGNTVILFIPNKGFVAYHHLQNTGLPYEGMPVDGTTKVGYMGNTGNSRGVHVDVQYFDSNGRPKLVMDW